MIVAQFTTNKAEISADRTAEDFYKFLGNQPARLGIVSRMNPDYTITFLTEGLGNIMYNEEKLGNKFQAINSMAFEWAVETEQIKKIAFAAVPVGDGQYGSEITMAFKERWYETYDTFKIDGSHQMCLVVDAPVRRADDYWTYQVKLVTNDGAQVLDAAYCQVGMKTRWIGNIMPEFHEMGFTKYTSNVEKQRNYITEHRNDINYSSRYDALEDMFIKIAAGTDEHNLQTRIYKLDDKKKLLLENFTHAKNESLMWQKSTMDANGKCTLFDREGRPLIAGDGLMAQINRFATKIGYNGNFSVALFKRMIQILGQKCKKSTGNTWTFIVNTKMYADIQDTLLMWLQQFKADNTYIYSKAAGNKITVGTEFVGYSYMGNTLIFKTDKALDAEWEDKGYGVLIDLTADATTGSPAMQGFTIKGKEFVSNDVTGVAFKDGPAASPVAGAKLTVSGYAGLGVFNPYRSVIIFEN